MNYQDLLDRASDYVRAYMREHDNSALLFHNRAHTESVVAATSQIAAHSHLGLHEQAIATCAALFADTGYYTDPHNPGPRAAALAEGFLVSAGADAATVREVGACIRAALQPQPPATLPGEVVQDALYFYLGSEEFPEQVKLLRRESEALYGTSISKKEWCLRTIALLEHHRYHTLYCRQLLNRQKRRNLERLKKKGHEAPAHVAGIAPVEALAPPQPPGNGDELQHPEKGTETLFRVTSGVSQRLSEQADNKANILISVNTIMLSILLSVVVARLERYPHLTLPMLMFLGVNLVTITFSILATRPSVPQGRFDLKDVETHKVNLLFFGNFYRMNFDDYLAGMHKVLGDRQYLNFSFIKNLYEHGVVLGRKYRKLKVAYNIFMYGIIASVVAFVIATEFFAPD